MFIFTPFDGFQAAVNTAHSQTSQLSDKYTASNKIFVYSQMLVNNRLEGEPKGEKPEFFGGTNYAARDPENWTGGVGFSEGWEEGDMYDSYETIPGGRNMYFVATNLNVEKFGTNPSKMGKWGSLGGGASLQ